MSRRGGLLVWREDVSVEGLKGRGEPPKGLERGGEAPRRRKSWP